MIRVVMFDLGQTLVDAQLRPFPHVQQALQAIAALRAADGKALKTCLVSDFTLAVPPPTPAKVKPLFAAYLQQLDSSGLRPFFEPVAKRITLSTHAGVAKPDRRVFDKALQRLGSSATLGQCLFITENGAHVKAARKTLGMQALQFKTDGVNQFDFDDWSQVPALVAHLLDPQHANNLHTAVKTHLAARGMDLQALQPGAKANQWLASGQTWHAVNVPGHAELGTVHVALPAKAMVQRGKRGALQATLPAPDASDLAEAREFAASLASHGQIGGGGAASTHAIETDSAGRRLLVRKRYSAL